MHGGANGFSLFLARGYGVDLEPEGLEGLERYEHLQKM